MNENDELNYVSSIDPYQAEIDKPSVDAKDEKTLEKLVVIVDGQIKLYHTISGMKLFPDKFSADEREAMCNQYVELLTNLRLLITNAIDGIKERQNGR